MSTENRPVLNPVLSFKRDPRLAGVTGRSADESQVVSTRLSEQKEKLAAQFLEISTQPKRSHAGKFLVAVKCLMTLSLLATSQSRFLEPH